MKLIPNIHAASSRFGTPEDLKEIADWTPPDAEPPGEFPERGEDIPTDFKCPKCGYEWSGKAKNND